MRNLYLFDIDGTMVDMTASHVAAYKAAYMKILGIGIDGQLLSRQFGKIEEKIHEAMFSHYGITDYSKIKPIIRAYKSNIIAVFKKEKISTLPGVKKLLMKLKKEGNILGIVTGNSERVGSLVLKRTGLNSNFTIFSFHGPTTRAGLVKHAIKKAKSYDKVIVIGDSPYDIQAGKANSAITVAVATGRYSLKELKKEKPDYAITSLIQFPEI
jgi:phosphoglycolate phosphatase